MRHAVAGVPLLLSLAAAAAAQDFHAFRATGLAPETGADWRAVAAGDLDGDGDADQVFACFGAPGAGQRNFWLRNDGTGLFARASLVQLAPSLSRAVVLADFDRDGDLDAFFGNQRHDALCRNEGNGGLALAAGDLPAVDRETYAAAAGDVDGDGDLDIVCACGGQDVLYRNDGNGRFTDASDRLPAAWDATVDLDLGDYDGDGDLDLLRVNRDAATQLCLNDGNGTFAPTGVVLPAGTFVSGGDVDGDGDRDFVLGIYGAPSGPIGPYYRTSLFVNQGGGVFTAVPLPAPLRFEPARLADLDGDGDLDLAVQGRGVLRNDGTGTFAPDAPQPWLGRDFADIDGDGDLDLIGEPTLRNVGNALFPRDAAEPELLEADQGAALALVDFDGDGDLDFVRGRIEGVAVLANDGRGTFRPVLAQAPNSTWGQQPWLAADWTGDGLPDLVNHLGGTLFENLGGAGLQPRSLPEPLLSVVTLDADGDGDLDLCGVRSNLTAAWYRNQAGTFAAGVPFASGVGGLLVAADLDGDARADVVGVTAAGAPLAWRCSGNGVFAPLAGAFAAGLPPVTAACAVDLDGDGDADLALGHDYRAGAAPRLSVLANDGSGRFAVAATLLPWTDLDQVRGIAAADLDGDGERDLVASPLHNGGQAPRLLRNAGRLQFADATGRGQAWRGLPAAAGTTVLLGDLDGDGDVDAVATSGSEATFLRNLQRQLIARGGPALGATWQLEVLQRPLGGFGAVLLSLAELQPAVPTPFGSLRIDPRFATALGPALVAGEAPVAVAALPVPNLPALRGLALFAQQVAFTGSAVRLGNELAATIR